MAFFQERDYKLFKHFNKEHINDWVGTPVIIYKLDMGTTETNLYGESVGGKNYQVGFKVNALISKDDQQTVYEQFGSDIQQTIQFRFLRDMLEEVSLNPDIGDVIYFFGAFFVIDGRVENELVAGNPQFNHSIIVNTRMERKSKLNIDVDEAILFDGSKFDNTFDNTFG